MQAKLKESANYINNRIGNIKIDVAVVLGSGLGDFAESLSDVIFIEYSDIPSFPISTVRSHKGRLAIGKVENKTVCCMQGRFHCYEGWTLAECVYPIQVFKMLGIENLILTNAAGCINTAWTVGDFMIITDHIKMFADSPLRGPNPDFLGDRFFDMGSAWSKELNEKAHLCAKELNIDIKQGVYMMFGGPQFETPAEIRMARILGADAAGMSTVPEAIAASQMKMKTLGLSCMVNMAAGIKDEALSQDDIDLTDTVATNFISLISKIVCSL